MTRMPNFKMVVVFATLIHATHTFARKGFVEQYQANRKFICTGKKIATTASELQCVHYCLRNEKCGLANYKDVPDEVTKNNCETFGVPANHQSCSSVHSAGWKTLIFMRKIDPKDLVYKSCKEVAMSISNAVSGVYKLEAGRHFCRIKDVASCGPGGWTLALKIDGSKDTFSAQKNLWKNNITFNVENGLKSFDNGEAKFSAFSKLSFNSICIGFKYSGTTKWLRINKNGTSLQSIFESGNFITTAISRATWKSLIAGSSLQHNCNRQGFNVKDIYGKIYARIGYISNQENDCATPDSFIALGSDSSVPCSIPHLAQISCGNLASCSPDNGDKSLATIGFILIQ